MAQIAQYGGRLPDALLVHQGQIPDELTLKYSAEEAQPVEVDLDSLYKMGVKVVEAREVMSATSLIRHDPARTAKALIELFEKLVA